MKKNRNNSGQVVIESMIVYVITIALLFLILALMCALYQRFNVGTIANDTAAKIAQNFRVAPENINEQGIQNSAAYDDPEDYRYLFSSKYSNILGNSTNFGNDFAIHRLMRSSFGNTVDPAKTDVDVKVVVDGIGKRHVEVCISGKYNIPFAEIFDYFHLSGFTEYKVYGYAECLDLLELLNEVRFIKNVSDTIVDDLGGFGSAASSVIKAIGKIFNFFQYFLAK